MKTNFNDVSRRGFVKSLAMASSTLLFPLDTLFISNNNKLRVKYLNSLTQESDFYNHQSKLAYLTSSFNADVLIINEIVNQKIDLINIKTAINKGLHIILNTTDIPNDFKEKLREVCQESKSYLAIVEKNVSQNGDESAFAKTILYERIKSNHTYMPKDMVFINFLLEQTQPSQFIICSS